MLRRSFAREMTLLSLPLLIIVGVIAWNQWKQRFCTPHIGLIVDFDAKQSTGTRGTGLIPDERFNFTWVAHLRGGPQLGYRFGWNESVVAQTPRGPIVVWQQKVAPAGWQLDAISGSSVTNFFTGTFQSSQGLNRATHSRTYEISATALPIDTKRLEWQGEVAAIPADATTIWQSPLPQSTLQNWSQIRGSAAWQRTINIPYNTQKLGPVQIRVTQPRPDHNNRMEVNVVSRSANRRAYWCLLAIKNGKQRIIWTPNAPKTSAIGDLFGHSHSPSITTDHFDFDMTKIPADWGQILFCCDTVFDISNRALGVSNADQIGITQSALAAFEKQTGGYRVSRRVVLRPR